MKIQDLMQAPPTSCQPGDPLDQVTRSMWSGDLGWLPVVDDKERLLGVLTDRDACMHATTSGKPLSELLVKGCMQSQVVACRPTDSVDTALARLSEHQIHRLPVVDERNHLIGVFTLGDLARAWRAETGSPKKSNLATQAWQTFAAIHRPHGETPQPSDIVVPATRKPDTKSTAPATAPLKPAATKPKGGGKAKGKTKQAGKKKSTRGKG